LKPYRESVDNHTHQFKGGIAGYHTLSDRGEEGASPFGDWSGGASQKMMLVIDLFAAGAL
jgi:hypothetical protein